VSSQHDIWPEVSFTSRYLSLFLWVDAVSAFFPTHTHTHTLDSQDMSDRFWWFHWLGAACGLLTFTLIRMCHFKLQKRDAEQRKQKQQYLHRGITCSICEQSPLRGVRYKCVNCVKYEWMLNYYPFSSHQTSLFTRQGFVLKLEKKFKTNYWIFFYINNDNNVVSFRF
jgi:hypothetical protein